MISDGRRVSAVISCRYLLHQYNTSTIVRTPNTSPPRFTLSLVPPFLFQLSGICHPFGFSAASHLPSHPNLNILPHCSTVSPSFILIRPPHSQRTSTVHSVPPTPRTNPNMCGKIVVHHIAHPRNLCMHTVTTTVRCHLAKTNNLPFCDIKIVDQVYYDFWPCDDCRRERREIDLEYRLMYVDLFP